MVVTGTIVLAGKRVAADDAAGGDDMATQDRFAGLMVFVGHQIPNRLGSPALTFRHMPCQDRGDRQRPWRRLRLVEAEIRDQLLELAVLLLEQLQSPKLADAEPSIQLLSAVECLLGHADPADHFGHRRARLGLPQRVRNLLLGVPALLQSLLLLAGGHKAEKLSLKPEEENGGT